MFLLFYKGMYNNFILNICLDYYVSLNQSPWILPKKLL